jgi:hypothetical protein
MPGTPMANFTDWAYVTPSVFISGPDKFLNEAVKLNYEMLTRSLVGRDMAEFCQGGADIREQLILDDVSSYETFNPNAEQTFGNPQGTGQIVAPWRFSKGHMSWVDQEVLLNQPPGASEDSKFSLWKKVKTAKEQIMWNGIFGGMEADFWASPHNQQANMESSSSNTPMRYSIPVFVNEDNTNFHPGGWTTIQSLDPASETRWRNKVVRYDHTDAEDSDGDANGLFDALADMRRRLKFRPPPKRKELYEAPGDVRQFIAASRHGLNLMEKLSRESNDRFALKQDPAYMHPMSGGVEMVHVAELDAAALYYDGANYVSEMASTLLNDGTAWSTSDWTRGPRFYFIDMNYIKAIFHNERYFHKHKPRQPDKQINSWFMPVEIWWQLFCTSRQRLGIVGPGCPAGTASSALT